ncbi:MAG: cytochrome c oxidase subunit II [Pseudomonadota bacterium]|nr:cytochrome c oxidase subunit II [Pseudomonadota bacterium]
MSFIPPFRGHLPRAITLLAGAAAAGCSGVQSTLDPAGPAASSIAQTWWVMAIGATAILMLVMALLFYTLTARQGSSRRTPGVRLIFMGGLLLPSFTLIALLTYGTVVSRRVAMMEQPAELVIRVVARRFHWDFHYPAVNGAPGALITDVLVLPRERNVQFHVTSADVIHSFWIPRLGGKIDAIPGRVNVLNLRADKGGPISGQCAEFCGLLHAHMRFDVLALAPADFDRWLADGGRQPPPRARAEVPRPREVRQ